MASSRSTAAGKILYNSYWFGLEQVIEAIVLVGTSIAIARYLGPEKLGKYMYINFYVAIVTSTTGTGLASATRKYMSEFLGQDRPGTARAVYQVAYRYQLMGALLITVLGLAAVALMHDHSIRLMAWILIASIIPGVMSWVPAQANQAFEDVANNTLSALGYIFSYTAVIVATIHYKWDLVGIAAAMLVGRSVEVVLRTIPLRRKIRAMPLDELEPALIARIRRFCLQAIGIQLLMSVVWNRSEMPFLKHYSTYEQIGFYSLSFGLADRLLLIPSTFGNATGITLMVEASRDPGRVRSIVRNASRYLLFVVFPVHLGLAAVAAEAVRFVYGAKYAGAVPALIVAALLAIPKAFQEIPQVLIRTADRQNQLLVWFGVTGALNMVLDFLLIPHYGAVGAAWGNGLAQCFGVFAIWKLARKSYDFSLPMGSAVRLLLAGSLMAVVAFWVGRTIPGIAGLATAMATAVPVYVLMVRLLAGLEAPDRVRLAPIGAKWPGPLRRAYTAVVTFATPAGV